LVVRGQLAMSAGLYSGNNTVVVTNQACPVCRRIGREEMGFHRSPPGRCGSGRERGHRFGSSRRIGARRIKVQAVDGVTSPSSKRGRSRSRHFGEQRGRRGRRVQTSPAQGRPSVQGRRKCRCGNSPDEVAVTSGNVNTAGPVLRGYRSLPATSRPRWDRGPFVSWQTLRAL